MWHGLASHCLAGQPAPTATDATGLAPPVPVRVPVQCPRHTRIPATQGRQLASRSRALAQSTSGATPGPLSMTWCFRPRSVPAIDAENERIGEAGQRAQGCSMWAAPHDGAQRSVPLASLHAAAQLGSGVELMWLHRFVAAAVQAVATVRVLRPVTSLFNGPADEAGPLPHAPDPAPPGAAARGRLPVLRQQRAGALSLACARHPSFLPTITCAQALHSHVTPLPYLFQREGGVVVTRHGA